MNGQTRTSLAEINITPLVDVVLVLLVIFMITEPVLQSGIEVNVPKTRTVKEITEQRMVVTIDRDDNIFLNDQPVNIHDLPAKLHQAGVDPAHQSIYLRSDERVSVRELRQRDGCGEAVGNYQCVDRDAAAGDEGTKWQLGEDMLARALRARSGNVRQSGAPADPGRAHNGSRWHEQHSG